MRRALPDAAAAVGILLVALSGWLFVPRERAGASPTEPALRVVLVDTSASAVWRRRGWDAQARGILRVQRDEAERAGEDLAVVLFGWEVQRIYGPGPADGFGDATHLTRPFGETERKSTWMHAGAASRAADALEVAGELVAAPGRAPSSVVLVGDGTYTGTDPRPAIDRLQRLGARFHRVDLPPPDVAEVVPGALSMPEEVEIGAPMAATFEVFYGPGAGRAESTVSLRVGDVLNARGIELPVPAGLEPDEQGYVRWTARTELGAASAGWNLVVLRGWREFPTAVDADFGVTSQAVVRGGRDRLVAVVAAGFPLVNTARPEAILDVPSGTGLAAARVWPRELAADLERYDAVVTLDLPPDELPIELLRSYVERGGGWLAMIGDESLASFAPGTAVDFLPLRPPEDDPEPRDVVFLVDRSGSMAGERSENVRRAVLALMDEALPSDTVELRWFSERLSPAIPLLQPGASRRPADREEARRQAIDRVFASDLGGGPTALLGALEELAAARESRRRDALVFLLSDGRDNRDPDPLERAPRVLQRLGAARVRLVPIAVSVFADRELLGRLVVPGGRLEEVGSLLDVQTGSVFQALFRRELNRDRVVTGEFLPVLPSRELLAPDAPPTLGSEVLRAMAPGLENARPSIQHHVRAKATTGAETLWVSERGDPLLAVSRVGAGATAACAFSLTNAWRNDRDRSIDRLLAPLLRALARGHRGSGPTARVAGDELVLQSLPEDAPADLEARVFAADAQPGDPPRVVLPLSAPSEGADPRLERRVRLSDRDVIQLAALWDLGPGGFGSARTPRVEVRTAAGRDPAWPAIVLPLALPRQAEFVLPRSELPEARTDLSPVQARGGPRPHPAAPPILVSGMLLLTLAASLGSFARRGR